MAMNKYMHPRNIYKSPPNFKQLAIDYPEFREYAQQDITGKVTLNFKDLKTLRALSRVLLKKDFGLNVEMPLNKLIPTIPLRLNYILWLEDLLSFMEISENIRGIDIGTGASCVYPMMAAKKNNWTMLALEMDKESLQYAQENVARNFLNKLITIKEVNGKKLIEDVVGEEQFDFCMCNPPFFSTTEELNPFFKARKSSRPHPKNAFCATETEVVSKGGEVEFILNLINESKIVNKNIKIYSTMIGHKSSLPPLKKALREMGVFSFKEGEFCQGNTTRWGLAWTYHKIDLRKSQDIVKLTTKQPKPKQSLKYLLTSTNANEYALSYVSEKLLQLLKELQMQAEEVTRNKKVLRYFVTAFSNTWSNQRRKRREIRTRLSSTGSEANSSLEDKINNVSSEENMCDSKTSTKRVADEAFDGSLLKKLKITTQSGETSVVFFKFMIAIRNEMESICLELDCDDKEGDKREMLHQILQYVKNNLKV